MKYTRLILTLFICINSAFLFGQSTVAILPFTFADDGHISSQKGKEAQQFLIDYFHKKSKHLKIQTLAGRDVSVALNKAGITAETIDNFTTQEIANTLGNPDYILMGSINRSFEGTTALETGFGSLNDKNWKQTNVYGVSTSSTTKKYAATVSISIFTSGGTAIYEKSKGNIFIDTTPESWKNSIIWHVRHFPFYE